MSKLNSLERLEMLLKYFDKIENDTSAIVYHTRIFDSLMIERIAGIDVNKRSYEFDIYIPKLTLGEKLWNFLNFLTNYIPVLEIPLYLYVAVSTMLALSSLYPIINDILFLWKKFFLFSYKDTNFNFITFNKNNLTSNIFINNSVDNLNSIVSSNKYFNFYLSISIDSWLIICELLIVMLIFLFLYSLFITFEFASQSYIYIIISLIKTCIPPIDVLITGTIFFAFIMFNMFNTIFGDPINEIIAIYLCIVAVLILLTISICQDIFNFFCLSNILNNNISMKVLIYDIVYNFINFFRIFLSWIRFIFYDIQLEWLDFTNHYVDFENENLFFEIQNFQKNIDNDLNSNFLFLNFNKINYFLNILVDIINLIIILILNLFKFFMALYIFWLITDLFIIKIFSLRENKKNVY